MLYGQAAIDFAKKYRFAKLQLWEWNEDEGRSYSSGEWVEVDPEQFGTDEWQMSIPDNPEDLRVDDKAVYFINSYFLHYICGGPAEGGDYYHAGEPIESVQCFSAEKVEELRDQRYEELSGQYDEGDLYSVHPGTKVTTYIEDHFAAPWPTEPYHYE